MDDDKKFPQGQDDSFDEHELDLNTPEDLEAIEDITFADLQTDVNVDPADDNETESMSIFEGMDDLEGFGEFTDFEAIPETEPSMAKIEDDFTQEDLGYTPDNTASELLEDEPFNFETQQASDVLDTDEDMFASDAFDDVNSDFPEGDATDSLGDSQLFDYDPNATSGAEDLQADDIYGAGAATPPPTQGGGANKVFNKRRVVRLALMVVLAGVVYTVLRMFTGSGSDTIELTDATSSVGAPPALTATPAPVEITTEVEAEPDTEIALETTEPEIEIEETPEIEGSALSTAPGLVPAIELPVPAVGSNIQSPQQAYTPPAQVPDAGSAQIANKLNSLEASINAMDNRLSNLNTARAASAPGAGMVSPSRKGQIDDQALMEALNKINGIDRKISDLSDLQLQIQILNREVNSLKSDVVQQSQIVGQSQAQINQNMVELLDQHAPKMYVQAAIPGRAWLRSETGQLLTVIPGDEVAGFGRVMSIDAQTGTVVMSTRAVFKEQ